MKNLILLVLVIFFSIGCSKKGYETIVPNNPKVDDSLYVWRIPALKDTSLVYSGGVRLLLGSSNLRYTIVPINDADTTIIGMLNLDSKKNDWVWKDYIPGSSPSFYSGIQRNLYQYILGRKKQYEYCFSSETGETLWRRPTNFNGYIEGGMSGIGDIAFQVRSASDYKSTLYMGVFPDLEWNPIFSTVGENGYSSTLYVPVTSINNDGDTILYFQNRGYRYEVPRDRNDFYAYNLSTKKVLWKLENISEETSNTSIPAVDELNGRVYFSTHHKLFCWDMVTGEEVWTYPLEHAGILATDYLLHDGKLIMKTDQGYLWAVDAATGQELYYVKQGGCCVGPMVVHDGLIYYTDKALWVSDVNTGKLLWNYTEYGGFEGLPVFDDANNVMYIMGEYYMYCMKIPTF